MNVAAAFPVTDRSHVAEPRRVAQWLASRLDFSEERIGRVALVVSELATNLYKHAQGGEILLRPLTTGDGDVGGVEVIAVDKGPGMPELATSRRDGHSTSGTLGHGLGAIERQADWLDIYTHSSGTAIAARLWREAMPPAAGGPLLDVAAVHVAKPGEEICGDAWTWRLREGRLAVFVADGLGHGLPAHDAAEAAVRAFANEPESQPARIVEAAHAALRATRGAAIASLAVDLERGVARYAGLGNVAGIVLLAAGGRHNMVSHNGTAGHNASRVQEFQYPVPQGSTLVMFSDGLGTHWDLSTYPGLRTRSPAVIAGVLYRDHSRRRDDVTVVVVKERTAVAEKL